MYNWHWYQHLFNVIKIIIVCLLHNIDLWSLLKLKMVMLEKMLVPLVLRSLSVAWGSHIAPNYFTGFGCTSGFVCLHVLITPRNPRMKRYFVTPERVPPPTSDVFSCCSCSVAVNFDCCHDTMFSLLIHVKLLLPVLPWELLLRSGTRQLSIWVETVVSPGTLNSALASDISGV